MARSAGAPLARIAAAVVLAAWCACAAGAQQLSAAQEYFQQGYAYHTGDGVEVDLKKAVRYYLQALKEEPDMYEAQANAGRAYYALKQYGRAQRHLSRAVALARERDDLGPADEAALSSDLGSCFYQEGDLAAAEKWLRYAIKRNPGLAEAHYNLINLLVADGRLDEAKAAMAVAAQQAPSSRYGLFEGRLRSVESHAEWNPDWLVPAVVVFTLSLVAYSLYKRSRRT